MNLAISEGCILTIQAVAGSLCNLVSLDELEMAASLFSYSSAFTCRETVERRQHLKIKPKCTVVLPDGGLGAGAWQAFFFFLPGGDIEVYVVVHKLINGRVTKGQLSLQRGCQNLLRKWESQDRARKLSEKWSDDKINCCSSSKKDSNLTKNKHFLYLRCE